MTKSKYNGDVGVATLKLTAAAASAAAAVRARVCLERN